MITVARAGSALSLAVLCLLDAPSTTPVS